MKFTKRCRQEDREYELQVEIEELQAEALIRQEIHRKEIEDREAEVDQLRLRLKEIQSHTSLSSTAWIN